jgi:tetratricopeptide (TPR) repeat protein
VAGPLPLHVVGIYNVISFRVLSWAEWLARESGDRVLVAHALGCMSALHSGIPKGGRGGDPDKAIVILDAALQAAGTQAPAPMLSWLFARRAEEHAVAGHARLARGDVDQAARALAAVVSPDDGFFCHLSDAWLAAYRGNCERLLGQPAAAIEALELALGSIGADQAGSRSGVVADLAAAYASQGDADHACGLLTEAWDLAGQSGRKVAWERIRGVRQRDLAAYADSTIVRQLDELLTT